MELYHGSNVTVEHPQILVSGFYKDFGYGFYCTSLEKQARKHDYDIVEGPMADDQIWDYVEDFMEGSITREAFWILVKFKYPTHQMVFCTQKALESIKFERSISL